MRNLIWLFIILDFFLFNEVMNLTWYQAVGVYLYIGCHFIPLITFPKYYLEKLFVWPKELFEVMKQMRKIKE